MISSSTDLVDELANTLEARARNRLIGGDRQAIDTACGVGKWLNCGHDGHGRAIRVRDDSLGALRNVLTVYLGDNQRDLGILAPRGGVVDDDRAGCRKLGCVFARGRSSRREDRDIDPREVSSCDVLDDDLCALPRQSRTSRTSGRKETNRFNRETPLFQDRAHDATNLAGRTNNSNSQT